MSGMTQRPTLRVAAPDAEVEPFTPSPIQSRFRDSMRKGVEQNQLLAIQWSKAHFLEFKESVTVGMYDAWMQDSRFSEWFTDGMNRKRSAFELALLRSKSDQVLNTLLASDDPNLALRAATSIKGIKDEKPEKVVEETPEQRRANIIREARSG